MKTRISGAIIDGGFSIGDFSVEGETMIEAVLALVKIVAPHIEADRQLRIEAVDGWCKHCNVFHYDLIKVVTAFEDIAQDAAQQQVDEIHKSLAGMMAAMRQRNGGAN